MELSQALSQMLTRAIVEEDTALHRAVNQGNLEASKAALCGVPQFQLPQRTPGQTRQARGGRQRPPGGAWAGPGAHCGVGPAWVLGGFFVPSASPITVG